MVNAVPIKEKTVNRIIYAIAAVLCGLVIALFLAYFIILNSKPFIFYSFLAFLAIVPLGLLYDRISKYIFAFSIISIITGALAYTKVLQGIFTYYLIAVLILMIIMLKYHKNVGFFEYIALNVGALSPAIAYVAGIQLSQVISINIAIAGYYALFALIIIVVLKRSDYFERPIKMIRESVQGVYQYLAFTLSMCALVMLILPIWPANIIIGNQLPYIPISISNYSGPGNYSIYVNVSKYVEYLNTNLTNIRLGYSNRTYQAGLIKSYISQSARFNSTNTHILSYINASPTSNTLNLRLYLFPINQSYGGYLGQMRGSYPDKTKSVTGQAGNLETNGKVFRNDTVYYTFEGKIKEQTKENISISPYAQFQPVCGYSQGTSVRVSFVDYTPISSFMFDTRRGYDLAMYNATDNYSSYMHSFERFANSSAIGQKSGNFSIYLNDTCAEIAFVSENSSAVSLLFNESYNGAISSTREVMEYNFTGIVKHSAFFTYGIGYLSSIYKNLTENATASAG